MLRYSMWSGTSEDVQSCWLTFTASGQPLLIKCELHQKSTNKLINLDVRSKSFEIRGFAVVSDMMLLSKFFILGSLTRFCLHFILQMQRDYEGEISPFENF